MKSSSRASLSLIGKLAFSLLLLAILYRNTPLREIGAVLTQSRPGLLAAVLGIVALNIWLSALKWRVLLLSDHIDIPLSSLFVSYAIGGFFNVFLPSTIGGDSYRIYDVMKRSGKGARTAASVFADRLSGFVALTCLSIVASFFVAFRLGEPLLALLPILALAGLLTALFLLWRKTPIFWILRIFRLNRFVKLTAFCETFCDTLAHYVAEPRTLARVMGISFAFQFLLIFAVYLMALAIHAHTSFLYFLAFVPLITLLEALPISVYGLGVRDMGYVFFFQYAGLGELHTRALAIVFVGATFCSALFGGLLYLFRKCGRTQKSAGD